MAERNQFARPLRGLNTGDLGHGQHIAFGKRVGLQFLDRFRAANQGALGNRAPMLQRLRANVDHVGLAVVLQMAEGSRFHD